MKDKPAVKADIQGFIAEHGLQIHPQRDLDVWVDKLTQKGSCLCDPRRPDCPCTRALDEIARRGACTCTFLVNQDYLERYGYTKKEEG